MPNKEAGFVGQQRLGGPAPPRRFQSGDPDAMEALVRGLQVIVVAERDGNE